MPDCEKCPYLSRIERLEQDMDKNRESHSEFWDRINSLEKGKELNLEKITQALEKIKGVDAKIDKSQEAKHLYKHPLKMLGLDPYFNGNYKIDFDEVSDLPWFWQDDGPMIYLRVPDIEGIGEAVAQAVADYFKR